MTNRQTEECRKKNTDSKLYEFCSVMGHRYKDCYSLRQALRDGRVSKEKTEKNFETTPPANHTPVIYTAYPVPAPPTQTAYSPPPPRSSEPRNSNRKDPRRYDGQRGPNDRNNYRSRNYDRAPDRKNHNYRPYYNRNDNWF